MRWLAERFRQVVSLLHGEAIEFDLGAYRKTAAAIDALGTQLANETDDALKCRLPDLAAQTRAGRSLDDLLIETFALAREAARRTLGLRPFDVQVLAGLAMHRGRLAEMQTGEGKTLAAVLPASLNALAGRGVHVLTFNDYLARRDAEWMGPAYRFLGLSVGYVQEGMSLAERQAAYACDITYVTAKEAGFDLLRDQLCLDRAGLVHRPFHFAIVDEADSILIDEARLPLVIAGRSGEAECNPHRMADLVGQLQAERDFETDEYARNVHFTEAGLDRLEAELTCGDLHATENLALLTALNLALHARVLLRRDVDYIVREGRIELVDEFTGRVAANRRWPDGLQAAVEAKEGLAVQFQGTILGSIALQHFLKLYPKVAGMTATAQAAAAEFQSFYGLRITVIPPHRPCLRRDQPDVVFTHQEAKLKALIAEISAAHAAGRPVLVGTSSVAESERLAASLAAAGVPGRVLNARHDAQEAAIVAEAGGLGAVTIATNMAGRGTDIRLGGAARQDRQRVAELGGLYVIGTNRHESRRIDGQLRGRAGRQGDPGESCFFISLEDDLIQRYGVEELIPRQRRPAPQDRPIDDPVVLREIARAQRIAEGQNFDVRRLLWQYSSQVERQRAAVQARRQQVLLGSQPDGVIGERAAAARARLSATHGEPAVRQAEQRVRLLAIDRCWAEHLSRLADLRESVHLFGAGGFDPFDEFLRLAGDAYRDMQQQIDDEAVRAFEQLAAAGELDLQGQGLRGASATWTYLVSDNPFGNWFQRLVRGIKSLAERSE